LFGLHPRFGVSTTAECGISPHIYTPPQIGSRPDPLRPLLSCEAGKNSHFGNREFRPRWPPPTVCPFFRVLLNLLDGIVLPEGIYPSRIASSHPPISSIFSPPVRINKCPGVFPPFDVVHKLKFQTPRPPFVSRRTRLRFFPAVDSDFFRVC